MKKQKTAMHQAISRIDEAKEVALNQAKSARLNKEGSAGADAMFVGLSMARKFCTELLEAEKQQMGQSFDAGFNQNVYIAGKDYEKYKDKFFNETFENPK